MPTSASSTIRRCFQSPNYGRNATIARAEQTKQLTNRFSAIAGAGAVVALLVTVQSRGIFRYCHLFALVVVLALSAAVAVAVHLLYTRDCSRRSPTLRSCRNDDTAGPRHSALLGDRLAIDERPAGAIASAANEDGNCDRHVGLGRSAFVGQPFRQSKSRFRRIISLGVSYRNSQNCLSARRSRCRPDPVYWACLGARASA